MVDTSPMEKVITTGGKVRIREKKLADARQDYAWQTDAELARLDANVTTGVPYAVFLIDYATQLHRRTDNYFRFAVETLEGKHIGNCTYYNINVEKGEAEVGIMLGDRDYWDKGYGTDAFNALVDYVFNRPEDFKRLYLKSLVWNLRAHRAFEKAGFTPCGRMNHGEHDFILMEMTREAWQKLGRE